METDEVIPPEHVPHICATCASVMNLLVHEPTPPDALLAGLAAAPADVEPVHYHGCCPVCHKEPVLMFDADHNEYMVCEEHRQAWYIGRGNFSAWQHMTADQLAQQEIFLSVGCDIIPAPSCTCAPAAAPSTGGGADFSQYVDEFEQYVDDVAGELLAQVFG